jgi:phage terminase large subunit GpA-like protein
MFTPTPVRNTKQTRKRTKVNVTLWTVCSTVGALSVIGSVALMVGWKQQIPLNSVSEVQQAKAQVSQIREVYLEKLSRTDYNMDHLSSYSSVEGAPTLTGWRQLGAALSVDHKLFPQEPSLANFVVCNTFFQPPFKQVGWLCV